MAVGINDDELNKLKINFLDLIEELKKISSDLYKNFEIINVYLKCPESNNISDKVIAILESMDIIIFNIEKNLDDIDKVIIAYKSQDEELSLKIKSDIQNIEGSEV